MDKQPRRAPEVGEPFRQLSGSGRPVYATQRRRVRPDERGDDGEKGDGVEQEAMTDPDGDDQQAKGLTEPHCG